MAATYVDASTVSVVAPPRAAAGLAHVAVSNDGATYTSLPARCARAAPGRTWTSSSWGTRRGGRG